MSGQALFQSQTGVSRETLYKLETYVRVLKEWTRAINLVAASTLPDLWRRHMLDSAQLLPLLPALSGSAPRVLADLGSGAGFPGLVLALMGAGKVHLIEADQRKAAFLREVARQTDAPVVIHAVRIEELAPVPAVDVITARACAPLTRLLAHAGAFPGRGPAKGPTCLFLKGKRVEQELTEAGNPWIMAAERFPSCSDPSGTILRIRLPARETTRH